LAGEHMVKAMEAFINREEPMMVMEWLSINVDKTVMSKKKLAVKAVFYEILKDTLEFHSNDMIHRDLKRSKAMISSRNKLMQSQLEPVDIDTNN
jgi:serine/threonine protein kinase